MWQTHGGESDVKAEADYRKAATGPGMPGQLPVTETGQKEILPRCLPREYGPAKNFILEFQFPELWENKLLLFKALS